MNLKNYEESVARGLAHVGGKRSSLDIEAIQLLNDGGGSRSGCLVVLSSNFQSISMTSFFRERELSKMKQWSYLSSKVEILRHHMNPGESYLTEQLLWPLISDKEEIIDWYRQHHAVYELDKKVSGGDKNDPKSWMFYRYQSWLALNERWEELGERCERILAMQDEIKKDRAYLIDHRFYLALAKGDKAAMETVLAEKTSPAQRKRRYEQESGLTRDFIDSYAVIFAKLAWRNGYEVEVDTPWIPKEWLPVRPLQSYEDPWPFMQSFDIWQPFEGEWAPWSPKPHT